MLVMLAFSLAGGSVLATMFGKASAKAVASQLASDAALRLTTEKGWEKAFQALAWVDKSATAKFVMGTVWDEAASRITTEVSASLKDLGSVKGFTTDTGIGKIGPVEFQNQLMNYTDQWYRAVLATGRWVYNSSWGGQKTLDAFQKASPFFKTPKKQLSIAKTADRLELVFWMKYVLGLDYVQSGVYQERGAGYKRVETSRKSIDVNPRDKAYPKQFESRDHGFGFQKVQYQQAGKVIHKRINELHDALMGGPLFHSDEDTYPGQSNASLTTLRMAELALMALSSSNARMIKQALA